MTQRVEKIMSLTDAIIEKIQDPGTRRFACIHTYGVTQYCVMLALKRGLDAELASICGLLHDIYGYSTGVRAMHAHSGAEQARVILKKSGLFKKEEQLIILSAIFHHADKEHIHHPYEELLKDADILQCFMYDKDGEQDKSWCTRMMSLSSEINLPFTPKEAWEEHRGAKKKPVSRRELLVKTAKKLAKKKIVGERDNSEYMNLIAYWPEDEAFDELKNGWCAAFVYHVCMLSGFNFPIRYPGVSCRMAGVKGFYEWANLPETVFYIPDTEDVTPLPGDIIVYNNIIPPENREPNGLERDHIGIILSCENGIMQVAEGNVNNQNVSGIVTREAHKNTDGYIRIPDDYVYEGRKREYKSSMRKFICEVS